MNRLKHLREVHEKTQQDIADYLHVTQKAVSFYELGQRDMPNAVLEKLASYFHVSTDYLLGRDEPHKIKGVKIPVLGTIAAGIPVEAVEEILDYEEITEEMAAQGQYFALRVKGRSMEPKFIEGDTVIVKKQSTVDSGRVAVVLVGNEEATLKQVNIDENGITLVGYNALVYAPHYYNKKDVAALPVQILGEVVELRRKI